jgi:hypothetical protein
MSNVIAKMSCESVVDSGEPKYSEQVILRAVCGGSDENKSFAKYTPCASVNMQIDNPAAWGSFIPGKEYYVRFNSAEVPVAAVEVPVEVADTKTWRRDISALVEIMKASARQSRSRSLAVTKLEESVMWLGKDLQELDNAKPGVAPNPYPHSKDPTSPVIEKPAV